MQKLKSLYAAAGALVLTAAVSLPAQAALDVTGAVDELKAAGTAATTLIGAAIVFAGICMAGFALYRRIK